MGLGLPRRLRELGRLRAGVKAVNSRGKEFPQKLSEWRITSPSEILLIHAAELYGGSVREWEGAPGEGKQFELLTHVDTLDVLIPPGALTAHWEMWSKGGCQRRCNGTAMDGGEVCQCPADLEERLRQSRLIKPTACKPMTRLSVVLPRLPDVGVWRVTTSSINAGIELPGTVDVLEGAYANRRLIPASLIIEQRSDIHEGQTRHFAVPVLALHDITLMELGAGTYGAINPAGDTPALGPNATKAIEAPKPPAPPKVEPDAVDPADDEPLASNIIAELTKRVEALRPLAQASACMRALRSKFGPPSELTVGQFPDVDRFIAQYEPESDPQSAPPTSAPVAETLALDNDPDSAPFV
jgi:hypothetical protein